MHRQTQISLHGLVTRFIVKPQSRCTDWSRGTSSTPPPPPISLHGWLRGNRETPFSLHGLVTWYNVKPYSFCTDRFGFFIGRKFKFFTCKALSILQRNKHVQVIESHYHKKNYILHITDTPCKISKVCACHNHVETEKENIHI